MEFCSKKKLQVVVLVRPIHLYHLPCQNADFFVSINQSYQVWIDLVSWKDLYSAFRFCSLLYLQWFWNFLFLSFCFFWNDDGSNNLWISFLTIFFHILNHRKLLGLDLIVVESLIQGCQCVSCCQWYLSVKWYGQIKFTATGWFA